MADAASLIFKFGSMGVADVQADMRAVGRSQQDLERQSGRTNGILSGMFATAGGLVMANTIGRITNGIGGWVGGLINANAQTEMINQQLNFVTGSADKAKAIYGEISRLAILSPFSEIDFGESSVQLQAFGLDAVKWMETIGDVSAVTGKTMFQTTSAVTDAVNGQYRRLVEFGINYFEENGQLTLEYVNKQGELISTTIDANNRELRESTLQAIMNDQYGGAMAEFADTWVGQLSTLKDNIRSRMRNATSGIFGELSDVLRFTNQIFAVGWRKATIDAFGPEFLYRIDGVIGGLSGITKGAWDFAGAMIEAFGTGRRVKDLIQDLPAPIRGVAGAFLEFSDGIGDIVRQIMQGDWSGLSKEVTATVKATFKLATNLPGNIFEWVQDQLFGSGESGGFVSGQGPNGGFSNLNEIDGGLIGLRFGMAGARWNTVDWSNVLEQLQSGLFGNIGNSGFVSGQGPEGGFNSLTELDGGLIGLKYELAGARWGDDTKWSELVSQLVRDADQKITTALGLVRSEEQLSAANQAGFDTGQAWGRGLGNALRSGAEDGATSTTGATTEEGGDSFFSTATVKKILKWEPGFARNDDPSFFDEAFQWAQGLGSGLRSSFMNGFRESFYTNWTVIGNGPDGGSRTPTSDIINDLFTGIGESISGAWDDFIDALIPDDLPGLSAPELPGWFTETGWLTEPVDKLVGKITDAKDAIADAWNDLKWWEKKASFNPLAGVGQGRLEVPGSNIPPKPAGDNWIWDGNTWIQYQAPIPQARPFMNFNGNAMAGAGRTLTNFSRDFDGPGKAMDDMVRKISAGGRGTLRAVTDMVGASRAQFSRMPQIMIQPVTAGVNGMTTALIQGLGNIRNIAAAYASTIGSQFGSINDTMRSIGFNAGISLAAGMLAAIPAIEGAASAWRNAMIADSDERNRSLSFGTSGAGSGASTSVTNTYDLRGSIVGADIDRYVTNKVQTVSNKVANRVVRSNKASEAR